MSQPKKRGVSPKTIKWIWCAAFAPFALVAVMLLLTALGTFGRIPSFEELENPRSNLATEVYSEDGKVIGTFFVQNRSYVQYADLFPSDSTLRIRLDGREVPPIVAALISTEDVRFRNHSGIDIPSLARVAVKTVLLQNTSQGGGSTITQQLAKNLFPRDTARNRGRIARTAKLVTSKFKEWITALKLEYNYTKEEIAAMYLNTVEYGSNAYGIKSAAHTFFNKEPDELNVQEAAVLVGVVNAPTRYSPLRNYDNAVARRNLVLSRMAKAGALTRKQCDSISALPIVLNFNPVSHNAGTATYFREMLRLVMNAERPRRNQFYTEWDYDEAVREYENNPIYGWCHKNTKADGTGTAYQAGADVAYPAEGDTLTLYAQWEANTYKTEFRDWRGRTITSGTARYGATPTVPALSDTTWLADPDMNFDNVDGWRDDWWHGSPTFTKDGLTVNSRDTRANGKTVGANAAIHVEADADYSEANATNAAKSSGIGFNINNGNNSYLGWDACPNGRQCEVDAVLTAGLASSQTIEPWVQIANDQFNGYGTATVHRMQLTQVDPATHNGLARDGYVFTGWNKDPSKPVEEDVVYTAQYRPAVYKIRFDANGGTGAMSEQSHTYDRRQTLTANAFTREGYRFTGWNTRGDGKGKAFTDEQAVSNLLTHDGATGVLYAQWEDAMTAMPETGGTVGDRRFGKIIGGGVCLFGLILIPFARRRMRRSR